ncbi:MAG: C1 family peptidase [Bacteroidota bacterium]
MSFSNSILACLFFIFSFFTFSQGTGLNFDERAYRAVPEEERPLGFGENLPKQYSLRKFTPAVANQGSFGTCVGWSSTYYAATIEYATANKLSGVNIITANAFDPYFTYLSIADEKNYFSCVDGTLITSAAEHLMKKGVKRYNFNQLECGAKIDVSNVPENIPFTFTEYFRLIDKMLSAEENIANLKQTLSNGHPVVIGMALPQSFYDIDSTGLFMPKVDDKKYIMDYGGHAMCVIGYDDNRLGGTFEIVNSWGPAWGDKGFAYVKYQDFIDFTRMAVRFETTLAAPKSEVGCVFGDCQNGYGRFVYDNGNVYEGKFLNGERAGFGLYVWDIDQSVFGGEWEQARRNGKGQLTDEFGKKQAGFWKNDLFVENEFVINTINRADLANNLGDNLQFMSPKEVAQLLAVKSIVDTLIAQKKSGCIYGNCENGTGVFLASNFIYFGGFQNALRHGYGEMRWTGQSWGNAYVGNSEANSRAGIGAYYWPNGNKYYGEWSNGARNGLGAFFNINGEIQAGSFQNNNFVTEGLGFGNQAVEIGTVIEEPKAPSVVIKDKSTTFSQGQQPTVPGGKTKKLKTKTTKK